MHALSRHVTAVAGRVAEERSYRRYLTESVRLAPQGLAFEVPWGQDSQSRDTVDAPAVIARLEAGGAFEVTK